MWVVLPAMVRVVAHRRGVAVPTAAGPATAGPASTMPTATVPAPTPASAVPTATVPAAAPRAVPPRTAAAPPGAPPARPPPGPTAPLVALTPAPPTVVPAVVAVMTPPPGAAMPTPLLRHLGVGALRGDHMLGCLRSLGSLLSAVPSRLVGGDVVPSRLLGGWHWTWAHDIPSGCGCRGGRAGQGQRVWDCESEGGDSGSCPHDHSFLFGRGWACIYRPNDSTNAPFG